MNERIKELAIEAMVTSPAIEGPLSHTYFDKEKFAELIVQECIDIADSHRMKMDSGPTYIIEDFKKHFGVE